MRAEERSGWWLSAPFAAFLLAFAAYPILFAVALVFTHWDLVTIPSFAGLDNLKHLATDARFWRAVANTFVFLGIHVPLQIAAALALALALDRPLVLRAFWRAAFFLPVVISGAVVAILWSNLYATDVGLINGLLVRVGLSPVPWLNFLLPRSSVVLMNLLHLFGALLEPSWSLWARSHLPTRSDFKS